MTREEINEFSVIEPYCFETEVEERWYQIGCIDGLNAADKEPNISVLWHDASEEPQIGSNIVAIDTDGKWWDIQPYDGDYNCNGLNGWRSCIRTYDIQKWAYIDDLLPKGGEE